MKKLILVLFFISSNIFAEENKAIEAKTIDVRGFERLAIQDQGRIKPFDTFARESVQLLTGKQIFKGKNPTELMLAFLFLPDTWADQEFLEISHPKLKEDLGISSDKKHVSPQSFVTNSKLPELFNEVFARQKEKRKLDSYHRAILRINNQMALFKEIVSGNAFRMIPQALAQNWLAVSELNPEGIETFKKISAAYLNVITKNDQEGLAIAFRNFKDFAKSQNLSEYPADRELEIEIIYNFAHPFRISYILYLLAAIALVFSLRNLESLFAYRLGLGFMSTGFLIHAVGFGFRCWIAGRPPVSNMYESVIWVSFGTCFFGFVLEYVYRMRFIALAASIMATIALIVADSTPVSVLSPHINPLEPVLRSNYWLTIHVLTITLSYAAFALATGLGNIALYYYVKGKHIVDAAKLRSLSLFMYRSMQVGVVLLTAGTILGGWWADYSWGRFWGWDPKETWALIADLMYLAVLHARFFGFIKTFGTIVASVLCFSGIVMAWYGVNFVLGAGLHSYGFGSGGLEYVAVVLGIQLLYIGVAFIQYKRIRA